ncbi:hypothetical protein DFH08DRAFT_823740 [Mycena albidolilacea]|uniref:Uncharacterized protein n=1 Tax=Mycena albidolilacea TaxID=1033008 RepID=A0AAD6Z5U0_9AGAR|nr:hypothetical protein DFH08DRAFT_823740 [Mycena albidolilacea]
MSKFDDEATLSSLLPLSSLWWAQGLLYTISMATPSAKLVGSRFCAVSGQGWGCRQQLLLSKNVDTRKIKVEFEDTPKLLRQAQSISFFSQCMGGMLGLSIAESVFATELTTFLMRYAPLTPVAITRNSPTEITSCLPAALIPRVLRVYMETLRTVFVLDAPVGVVVIFVKNIKIGGSCAAQAELETKMKTKVVSAEETTEQRAGHTIYTHLLKYGPPDKKWYGVYFGA